MQYSPATVSFKDITLLLDVAFPKAKSITKVSIQTVANMDPNGQMDTFMHIRGTCVIPFEAVYETAMQNFDMNFMLTQSVHPAVRNHICFNIHTYDPNITSIGGVYCSTGLNINLKNKTIKAEFTVSVNNNQLNQITKTLLYQVVDETLLS